jgi:hypothetical protein
MNEQSNYPCKCGHEYQDHGEEGFDRGGYVFLEDVGHEVWQEHIERYPVCYMCNNECYWQQMNNLEYLEWKYDSNRNPER